MATPEEPQKSGPDREILLDATRLKGLAHPLRVRLLGLLREFGPSTATALAARVGESSGATSYHLRQLEAYGFVEDVPERGTRRERWWKAAHQVTRLEPLEGPEADDPEVRALSEEYLRAVALSQAGQLMRFMDVLPTLREDLGAQWESAWTLSDLPVVVDAAGARELIEAIEDVVGRYPPADPGVELTPGHRRVFVQFQVLPQADMDDPQSRPEETS